MADEKTNLPGQAEYSQQPPAYAQQPPQGYGQPGPAAYGQQSTNVTYVSQPAPATTVIVTKSSPNNYLVLAIFSLLCCFFPTGIVAVVFAAMVDGAWQSGDEERAHNYSKNAKIWSIVSIVIGVIAYVGTVVFVIVWFVVLAAAVADGINEATP
ncbi:uncharacterized protein LOC100378921 [Saccoglossus kowalevskii]|uniref:Proline-rich transmembrane protein 1-like n=1 Tax=Saccoglossus kowalevskii TaxID=10224 RepID=A0ABM0GUE5_SACKO|nr:PREDICTED: proline-rich transmembrane protein 1-like [Saccoglossus kowalevskii]